MSYQLSAVSYQLSVICCQLPATRALICLSRLALVTYSQVTSHDSRLTSHISPLTSHDSRFTLSKFATHNSHPHNSQLTIHSLTTHVSRLTTHDSQLTLFAPSKLQICDLIISLPCVLRNPGVQRFSSIFHFRLLQSHRVVRSWLPGVCKRKVEFSATQGSGAK